MWGVTSYLHVRTILPARGEVDDEGMGNIATVGEERRRCFGIGGKPFALCVVTSPRGSVQPARWMREFRAFGVVSAGELGAIGAVGAWAGCS